MRHNLASGNPSKSAVTNETLLKAFYMKTKINQHEWHDICPLDSDFSIKINADCLNRPKSYFTLRNPPFEYKRCYNIFLILHQLTMNQSKIF